MFVFGSGVLIGTPTGGTPINFGLIQEVSLSVKANTKSLFGQYNFPVAIGSGTRKMSGKAKMARISGLALGSLFFGITPVAGVTQTQFGETTTVPASSPYTYQTTNHTTWSADQGVVYAASGLPLTLVASGPTVGQYSVASGTYTFAAADEGAAVLVSYQYANSAAGENVPVVNKLLGPTVSFSANLFASDPTTGKQFSVTLYNCVSSGFDMATKLEDFMLPGLDFECFANAAGQVCQFNMGDTA